MSNFQLSSSSDNFDLLYCTCSATTGKHHAVYTMLSMQPYKIHF